MALELAHAVGRHRHPVLGGLDLPRHADGGDQLPWSRKRRRSGACRPAHGLVQPFHEGIPQLRQRQAVDAHDGATTAVVNPVTGEQYAEAPLSGPADIDAAMEAAATAFDGWRDATPSRALARAVPDRRRGRGPRRRADRGRGGEHRQAGGADPSEEIPPMVDQIRFFAAAARNLEGRSAGEYMANMTSIIRREPVGVCAQVAPWNYPMMMAVWKFAPAIAAGNTVVLKPSDTTPAIDGAAGRDRRRVPPAGRVQRDLRRPRHRPGDGRARHPGDGVDHRIGARRHARWPRAAAPGLKRVHLELGGKAPVVVFDDADIAAAAEGIAVAGYFNAGQDCTAATRVIAGARRVRRLRRRPRRAGQGHQDRRTRRRGRAVRSGQQPGPARPRRRLRRAHTRPRPRRRRRLSGSATPATSTSPPSSPTCARTTR